MPDSITAMEIEIRADLLAALATAWSELGGPGSWLNGAQRLAVMAEARHAWQCELCQVRKGALSPYAITGNHEHLAALPDAWLDVIHRVVTDSGRLTETWLRQALDEGLLEDEFIEVVSVAVITTTIDAFAWGIGVEPASLPELLQGEPPRRRPPEAQPGPGWVATIAPEDAPDDFSDFYANGSHFYIRRALTLVPAEVRRFFALMNHFYLSDPRIYELEGIQRAISRAQMEYLAARASALLGCYY